jgi:hypothetical protein
VRAYVYIYTYTYTYFIYNKVGCERKLGQQGMPHAIISPALPCCTFIIRQKVNAEFHFMLIDEYVNITYTLPSEFKIYQNDTENVLLMCTYIYITVYIF